MKTKKVKAMKKKKKIKTSLGSYVYKQNPYPYLDYCKMYLLDEID